MNMKTISEMTAGLSGVLMALVSTAVLAVEPSAPVIPLFEDDVEPRVISGLDLIPGVPGIEMIGIAETLTTRPVAGQRRSSTHKFRIYLQNASSAANLADFVTTTSSGPYPDPATTVGTSYFCAEDGQIDPNSEDFPCVDFISAGIASDGAGTRVLIVGVAFRGEYFNVTEGTVSVSRYRVHAFDADTGTFLWSRAFAETKDAATGPQLELEPALCAAGDFLGADGEDEVRIVYARQRNSTTNQFQYAYYDILTGNNFRTRAFDVPLP